MEYLGANKFVRQSCMLPHDIMHSMYNFPDIFHHIWTGPPGELEKYWMRNLDLASDLGIQPCVAWQNICVKLFFLNYILPKNVGLLSIICIYVYIYVYIYTYIYLYTCLPMNQYIVFVGPATSFQDYKHHVPVTCLSFSRAITWFFFSKLFLLPNTFETSFIGSILAYIVLRSDYMEMALTHNSTSN